MGQVISVAGPVYNNKTWVEISKISCFDIAHVVLQIGSQFPLIFTKGPCETWNDELERLDEANAAIAALSLSNSLQNLLIDKLKNHSLSVVFTGFLLLSNGSLAMRLRLFFSHIYSCIYGITIDHETLMVALALAAQGLFAISDGEILPPCKNDLAECSFQVYEDYTERYKNFLRANVMPGIRVPCDMSLSEALYWRLGCGSRPYMLNELQTLFLLKDMIEEKKNDSISNQEESPRSLNGYLVKEPSTAEFAKDYQASLSRFDKWNDLISDTVIEEWNEILSLQNKTSTKSLSLAKAVLETNSLISFELDYNRIVSSSM